jgi:hypothetical protein
MLRQTESIAMVAGFIVAACTPRQVEGRRGTPFESDVLTITELTRVRGTTQNAYSALERIRPLFLSIRPASGPLHGQPPRVYVFIDGSFAGDVDVLKTIPLTSVESIRRVQATTAYTLYGEIHAGDVVILVHLRR